MTKAARPHLLSMLLLFLLAAFSPPRLAADARFDLVGPRIDVRVTRNGETLPIASVPNLQPGDKLWVHPDLPATQSVKYLLVCVFLRGTTNPPPAEWFTRIETWNHKVREEGVFITVPAEAQQAVLLLAPETGGDFSTLRSAVNGRPGIFVRASQDLAEAGFEQARIEKYLASIRRVPPSEAAELQKRSALLARTLALKPNDECFKRPVDTQFTCLTQTGTQTLLDDGHGQTMAARLSTGTSSDLINAASYTGLAGGGAYSAYVGAMVDVVRLMGNLHTAQYQYIPAIAFPQGDAMNLRLNTPPSFHNPKSVLVIGLPAVQAAVPPPLRPANAKDVACLLQPSVVLPIEGAPLVFSTDFAHDLILHLNTPPGAPAEPDIRLTPDAFQGGLIVQQHPDHRTPLPEPKPLPAAETKEPAPPPAAPTAALPVTLTGTIKGRWGFDAFTGPTVPLQRELGTGWHIVPSSSGAATELIAGHSAELLLASTGTACVHTITFRPPGAQSDITVPFKPAADSEALQLALPMQRETKPGDLHLAIQQFGQPEADTLSTHAFAEPAKIASIDIHAADPSLLLHGSNLAEIASLTLGDLVFKPEPGATSDNTLRLALPSGSAAPPTRIGDHLSAKIALRDGRTLTVPVDVSAQRPVVTLLRKTADTPPNSPISLANTDDLPLSQRLSFTLKSASNFPRDGQVEIETLDGTLRTVLTLAPSGGLLLQDPHTIVATLDPLRSFGPSAFGPLHLRAVFPAPTQNAPTPSTPSETRASDWLPLATLVRLPDLTQIQCPPDITQSCTLTGANLFLLQSVSSSPSFADPVPVPDGYTGSTLNVPHASASTLFVRLRDDPSVINPAVVPTPPPTPAEHRASTSTHQKS
jgi:hypothetical protein